MKLHWKILIWLAAGVLVGILFQQFLAAPAWIGADVAKDAPRIENFVPGGPIDRTNTSKTDSPSFAPGDRITEVVRNRGQQNEQIYTITDRESLLSCLEELEHGTVAWFRVERDGRLRSVTLGIEPGSQRDVWLEPFRFFAELFIQLLKMLIIPLVLTSIITGVAGLGGGRDFGRLGTKTFLYYVATSFLAAAVGLILVNLIRPGEGAALGLEASMELAKKEESLWGIFKRMIPENIFGALSSNGEMLKVIFFALLFGYFITRVPKDEQELLKKFFSAAFNVMMQLADFALKLVPYGVFCLVVKVVGETGLAVFKPLFWYMLTVFLGLLIHSAGTLPLILKFVGGVSPKRWFKAMSPALLTAFSTSSSAMTLPVTLESVEKRGGVSNKTSSFVLPLGATINMDGTAIYECVGVIFLAQYYYAEAGKTLTLALQLKVVLLAMLASIGAAGIPSAGLVMMLTILSALKLPLEGAALILAVDRPLDMCRTMTNIWSDSCGTAVIAQSDGEPLFQSEPPPELATSEATTEPGSARAADSG